MAAPRRAASCKAPIVAEPAQSRDDRPRISATGGQRDGALRSRRRRICYRRLQDDVAGILESVLSEPVISESPHQVTGGGYQTVRLGDRVRGGFRLARPNLLPGFELRRGSRVRPRRKPR